MLGDDDPPASVLRHAYALGAPALRAGSDFFFEPVHAQDRPGRVEGWRWRELDYALDLPLPVLAAPVQLRNAAIAITALRALDVDIADEAFARGVADARLPGRLQRFERDGVEVRVDVGHNPQAARELAAWLRSRPIAGRTHAVYAALADKDARAVVSAFTGEIDRWWLAGTPEAGARGQSAETLVGKLADSVAGQGNLSSGPVAALDAALRAAGRGDRILVFGSFHAAETALRALRGRGSEAEQYPGV